MFVAQHLLPMLGAALWVWLHWLGFQVNFAGGGSSPLVKGWLLVSTLLLYLAYRRMARDHHTAADLSPVEVPVRRDKVQARAHSWSVGVDWPVSAAAWVGWVVSFLLFGANHVIGAALAAAFSVGAVVKYYMFPTRWSSDEGGRIARGGSKRAQLSDLRAVVLQADALRVDLLDHNGQLLACHQDQASKERGHGVALGEVTRLAQELHQALGLPLIQGLGHYEVERFERDWGLLGSKVRPASSLGTIALAFAGCTPVFALVDLYLLNWMLARFT